uniref:Uncharacterized protein n=1 Tax=Candidatus Kentrum sp. DK TaxID=2126562 RepID=A0A450SKM5_9GAMM|nr:MAG: hypothetical protein BECKDK2373C_GA0170839_104211 [Candidatus Kentron sp. DK]VFJ67039.1 MAG: hypothetical protein BECKDK2373B_GA0170837_11834 [Candidatus Kentron sp. DK]
MSLSVEILNLNDEDRSLNGEVSSFNDGDRNADGEVPNPNGEALNLGDADGYLNDGAPYAAKTMLRSNKMQ